MNLRRLARALYRLYPKTVLGLFGLAVLALLAVPLMSTSAHPCAGAAATTEPSLVNDRVWFDRYPESPHEILSVWLLLSEGVGVYQEGSAFRATFDVFEHQGEGGDRDLRFLHDGEEAHSRFVASRCDDAPPFDLCLTVEDPARGSTRYYGFSDEDEGEQRPELAPYFDAARRSALTPRE